ncbi:putative toxin-antitoxin system toxin component, PIN family [Nostoc sp. LPT]|uniref:putative toxin-antitoxin system toxin component, PIN family n=1 Tax=Nostoc sp. LPT TaxID=2815387 RepID=UPI0025FD2FCA|nr:putative toxin-antitoxin system toxin component, PIN family [Nostoc sp. LPT]
MGIGHGVWGIALSPLISPTPQLHDLDDNVILKTVVAANAEVIITGDLDLLVLTAFNAIPILTPQEFLNWYFPEIF